MIIVHILYMTKGTRVTDKAGSNIDLMHRKPCLITGRGRLQYLKVQQDMYQQL